MVVAYGRIIKPPILAHLSMVNVHFSLLPRWRGAAPVERALLAGDDVTGVCIMDVEEGLDTGGVYARREVPIGPRTTAPSCVPTLVEVGTELLVDVLAAAARRPPSRNHGDVTYAAKIEPFELEIDWTSSAVDDRSLGARRRGVDDVPRPPAQGAGQRARPQATASRARSAPTALVGDGRRRAAPRHRAAGGQGGDAVGGLRQRRPS